MELPLFADPVSAGFPSPADDYIERPLDLNDLLIKNPPATFFVKVKGDSMLGAHIAPGDILVVDRSLKPTHNRIIIASLAGEFTVKRLVIDDKQILLVAENPKYPPIRIQEGSDLLIFGVVTAVVRSIG